MDTFMFFLLDWFVWVVFVDNVDALVRILKFVKRYL